MAETEIAKQRSRGRAELIAALAGARSGISEDAGELVERVNVPGRIRKSLSDAPLKRAATALVAGLVSSRFLNKQSSDPKKASSGWLHRIFPDLDFKKILKLLLKSYLEPDQVDLRALLRDRLRDYLK